MQSEIKSHMSCTDLSLLNMIIFLKFHESMLNFQIPTQKKTYHSFKPICKFFPVDIHI